MSESNQLPARATVVDPELLTRYVEREDGLPVMQMIVPGDSPRIVTFAPGDRLAFMTGTLVESSRARAIDRDRIEQLATILKVEPTIRFVFDVNDTVIGYAMIICFDFRSPRFFRDFFAALEANSVRRSSKPAADATAANTEHARYLAAPRSKRSANAAHGPNLTAPRSKRSAADAPDNRAVLAYGDSEIAAAGTIPAAAGFMVLSIYFDAPTTRRVSGYTAWPVICWKLVDGESPLPITFGLNVPFHPMCHLAIQSPDKTVVGFDDCWFPTAAEWLRNRQRVLRRRT